MCFSVLNFLTTNLWQFRLKFERGKICVHVCGNVRQLAANVACGDMTFTAPHALHHPRECHHTHYDEITDLWRTAKDDFVNTWEEI